MSRPRPKVPLEIDPSQFLVLPCPRPTPGTFRINNRIITVRTCTGCGLRTTIPGRCVLCGAEVVGPKPPASTLARDQRAIVSPKVPEGSSAAPTWESGADTSATLTVPSWAASDVIDTSAIPSADD